MNTLPYISGTNPVNPGPLWRFLPPLEEGTVSGWLAKHAKPGEWVLDPFGFSPRLVLEAARGGYRVLVTVNNPITRFLIEVAASAPSEADLKSAIADLAASRKGDERLETHLQSLYVTACEQCGRDIQAQAFLWRKGDDSPYARVYECPHCEDKGERATTAADIERAQDIMKTAGLHYSRVLERVAPLNDPDREYAEEALQAYLPRAIYALATLVNRLDGLNVPDDRRRLITALILTTCDAANSLYSAERPRPKQLTVSNQFRENNLWLALEQAIALFAETGSRVPCEAWPKKIPEGGICLFDGRLKTLAEAVRKEIPISAVTAAIPRPNQAFWTMSALWAGWLWGREAAEPFKIALRRRRYDWAWSATALRSAFHHLSDLLALGTPVLGLLGEPEAPFLTSTLTAASMEDFDLQGLALRTELDPIQIVWARGEHPAHTSVTSDLATLRLSIGQRLEPMRDTIHAHLAERGEPATYLHVHSAALTELAVSGALKTLGTELDEAIRKTQSLVQAALTADPRFVHHSTGEGVETGLWGLLKYANEPLADRVEMAAVYFLQRNPDSIYLEIEDELYSRFPGLLTPSKALIYQVLNSYAVKAGGAYRLREEEAPALRRADLEEMTVLIERIGTRLGYTTHKEDKALIWKDADGGTARVFYLIVSALIGRAVRENSHPPEKCLLVLPGGRAALAAYKQRRDLALAEKMRGWQILKFRLLRALAEIPVLTRETLEEQIVSDPIEQTQGQMMMF
jgi:hypothetical protein